MKRLVKAYFWVLHGILVQASFGASFWENDYDLTVPANVTTISGDYREYEAENNLVVQSRLEYLEGSSGVLAAGQKIHLKGESVIPGQSVNLPSYNGSHPAFIGYNRKMGFMAHEGSTVWGLIDGNFNGISDYIEELDMDGDGLFDALENALGTSNGQGVHGYEIDVNGDGIFDKITNAAHGGTTSQFIPGVIPGYLNKQGYNGNMSSFYQVNGTYSSLTVGFSDPGFVNTFFPSISEWFNFYFTTTYTYFSFLGWSQGIDFYGENGVDYAIEAYWPSTGWLTITSINGVGQSEDVFYGKPNGQPFDFLSQLPVFVRIAELGKADVQSGGQSSNSDTISIEGTGEVLIVDDQGYIVVTIPPVLSLENGPDWTVKKIYGDTSPWEIDLDGDGTTDVTLDPINRSGKVSVPILGTTVELEVNENGGWVSIGKYKIGQTADGELTVELPDGITGGDGTLRFTFAIPKPNVAVDLNRDGNINFNKYDSTAVNDPYVFWVNNDFDKLHTVDGSDSEEDDLEPLALGGDAVISDVQYKRDLEDFSRIWLDLTDFTASHSVSDQAISLKVRIKETDGYPSLNLFHAVEVDGLRKYLTDEAVADSQLQGVYGEELCSASYGAFIQTVPRRAWENLPSSKFVHLLFEGQVEGEGELMFYFEKNGQTIYSFDPIHLDLVDVEEMYETWTVGDVTPGGIATSVLPASVAIQSTGLNLSTPDPTFSKELDYILFVHGWNMTPFDKDWFADTAFKRLWHQGYKGRFGAFRWPTLHSFNFLLPWQSDHFDASEERAWNSAQPLADLLSSLSLVYRDVFGSRVKLYAHSMGNIVASESLRLLSSGAEVDTYVSGQAAISAHVWDNSTAPMFTTSEPNIYGYYWQPNVTSYAYQWETEGRPSYMASSNMPGGVRYVNHYNQSDWALSALRWQLNQQLKPDLYYDYSNLYFNSLVDGRLDIPDDIYRIFSYVAPSHSFATGAENDVNGLFQRKIDLDLDFQFGNAHKGHSAQFRSTIQKRWNYWRSLLVEDMLISIP